MTNSKQTATKRITSFLLALLMLFTIIPFTSFVVDEAQAAAGDSMATAIWVDQRSGLEAHTVSGEIWEDFNKQAGLGTNILSFEGYADTKLGNVPLYYQWMDIDGSISPIYKTVTHADGTFNNFIPAFTDMLGRTHTFVANYIPPREQKIKTWVDPVWAEQNGYNTIMDTYYGSFGSLNQAVGAVEWRPGALGQNVIRNNIILQKKVPDTFKAVETVDLGQTPENIGTMNLQNRYTGMVYWDWGYAPFATYNGSYQPNLGDVPAANVTVYLTKGTGQTGDPVKNWKIKTNSKGEFQMILADPLVGPLSNPDIFARYTSFWVEAPDGSIGTRTTGGTNIFLPYGYNHRGQSSGMTNEAKGIELQLKPAGEVFDIVNYDTMGNLATAGDTAVVAASGWHPSSGPYTVRWDAITINDKGEAVINQVAKQTNIIPTIEGKLNIDPFKVPDDLKETTTYRATLMPPGTKQDKDTGEITGIDYIFDAFTAVVATVDAPVGAEGTVYKQGTVYSPGITDHTYSFAVDISQEAIDAGFGPLPNGLVLDPATGKITGTPEAGTAGAHPVQFIVTGKAPVADAPEYKLDTDAVFYILDGNIAGPAMEDTLIDPAKVKLTTDGKDALPADYTLVTTIAKLPSAVTFGVTNGEEFGGTPAVDADTDTTIHNVDITYTVTRPNPKYDPNVAGSQPTITDTVTQVGKDFVVLEKLTITGTLPDGKVGVQYPATTPTVVGGEGPYTYAASGLPAGLSIDPTTGAITGKPTTIGDYQVEITVTDNQGYTAVLQQTVKITDPDNEKYDPTGQNITVKVGDTPEAKDGIANTADLPDDATYSFKETPDTSKVGTFPATVIVTYADGTTDEVEINIIVQDLESSALPKDLEQVKQTVVGNIDGFKDEMENNGTKIVAVVNGEITDIVGTINPDGTFTFPLEDMKHGDEVKAQLTEPGKKPTTSTDSVVIDKQGPSIENPLSTPEAGIKVITATTDDPAATFTVTVGTQTFPATVDVDGNIKAVIPANIPGEVKIVGVDKFDNESSVPVTEALAVEDFRIELTTAQSKAARLLVKSEKGYAEITLKVIRDGAVVFEGKQTANSTGSARFLLGSKPLEVDDEIIVTATFGALNSNMLNVIVQK